MLTLNNRTLMSLALAMSLPVTVFAETRSEPIGGVPVLDSLPSSPAELQQRVPDPELANFVRNAELVIGGVQSFTLGERIPLGPADHTPWARPLAGGPLRVTVIDEVTFNHDI